MTISMDKTKLRQAATACLHLSFVFEDQLKNPDNIMTDVRRERLESSRKMWLEIHDEIMRKIAAWDEKFGGGRS